MKILQIIAQKGFRDEELDVPNKYFLSKDITVDVASQEKGDCIGKFGMQVVADRALSDVAVQEYFAIVITGGPGAKDLFDNKEVLRILNEAVKQNIVIAAICIAPIILAKHGFLEGKKATVWNEDSLQGPKFESKRVIFVDKPVVSDGLFVTGNGPEAAQEFAEKVLEIAECEKCFIR